jgi:hypothetical protein
MDRGGAGEIITMTDGSRSDGGTGSGRDRSSPCCCC